MKHQFPPICRAKKYTRYLLLPIVSLFLALQMLALPANATGVYEMPPVDDRTWLLDRAEVFSPINEAKISNTLQKLAKETGNEVRMVSIRRLDYGETTQSFTDRLFEQWFPTPEAQAHQTLLVIDTLTNTTGIRTGEAVKTIMPDEIAKSVASETVLVPLRSGDKYNQAFADASDRLGAVLAGKPDPGPPQVASQVNVEKNFTSAEETKTSNATVWVVGLLIVATIVPMVTYYWYVK
jgi:uncharacterized protein